MQIGGELKLVVFDIKHDLFRTNDEDTSKVIKKFLNKQGLKGKKLSLKIAKAKVKKVTGNYYKSIKKGKVYKSDNDYWAIRIYSNAPHSHLIEDGFDLVKGGKKGSSGRIIGKVKGKKVLAKFNNDFSNRFYEECNKLVDDLLDKGFSW